MSEMGNIKYKFNNPNLKINERIEDLLTHMTIEEKIDQLTFSTSEIKRLNIPSYNYWSECLHGVARNGKATVFPQSIGLAATWNRDLIYKIGVAISDEARAKYQAAQKKIGHNMIYQGLTFWSPNINIFRDPRWGRGQETYGEDPLLTSELAKKFINGLQGDDPKYLKVAATAKHFTVHSGPESIRHHQNVEISKMELFRTYLPAFKEVITKGNVEIVMGAYNAINGIPCCINKDLLIHLLREEWGFQGHVVTDCGAIDDLKNYLDKNNTPAKNVSMALLNGCDLICGNNRDNVLQAINEGLMQEKDIDNNLYRIFTTRFKLGMFDPPGLNPYENISESVIDCSENRTLAYRAAIESLVLLKNKNNILPLKADEIKNLLILGPVATSMEILLGNYYGISSKMVTLLEGILNALPEGLRAQYRMGMLLDKYSKQNIDWAINEAKTTKITIVCVGFTPQFENEEGDALLSESFGDRDSINLPLNQVDYIKKVASTGTKIILCVSGGSPINLSEIEEYVEAILLVWYPGEEGGNAVADILFGKEIPSGKLPVTFIRSTDSLPHFEDYDMRGRTYRFLDSSPDYPFGFGLSYTRFTYSDLHLSSEQVQPNTKFTGSFVLTNEGHFNGEEIYQIYLAYPESAYGIKRQLIGFDRVQLESGQSKKIQFIIDAEKLLLINNNGETEFHEGEYQVYVGGCSPIPGNFESNIQEPLTKTLNFRKGK